MSMVVFAAVCTALAGVAPRLCAIPPFVAAIGGLAWPLVHAARYRRRLAALRRDIRDRYFMRSALDATLVPYGKRYNLFAITSLTLMGVGVGWVMLAAMRGHQGDGMALMLVLWPIALALHLAGRRVNDVQRRRRIDPTEDALTR